MEEINATNATGSIATMPPKDPYHEMEFEVFLKEIGNSNLPNWTILAESLNISRATVLRWKNHPLAKQAINSAIETTLKNMEEVGKNDWKMYREKLKMLGIKDKQTVEHEGEINIKSNIEIAKKLQNILTEDDTVTEETSSDTPNN